MTKTSTVFDLPALFIDTWGWLALEDVKDADHLAVRQIRERYEQRPSAWVTTDYVLNETITRLFSRRPFHEATTFCSALLHASEQGALTIEPITRQRFRAAYELRLRYQDKPKVSFTDLTSFAVMRELRIQHALTRDRHFQQTEMGFIMLPASP